MNHNFEILNSITDSISVIDKNGEIIYTNTSWKEFSEKNSGEKSKTGAGVNYLDLCKKVTGEELNNAKDALRGIMSVIKRKSKLFELEYPCHSMNEQRWFLMRVSPVNDDTNHTIISHVNITKRKHAEEQVQIMNERLSTTMFKIVHDIQSPLQSIEGLIYLFNQQKNDSSRATYMELIGKSMRKLKDFIQTTLIMSGSAVRAENIDFMVLLNDFFESIKYKESLKIIKIKASVKQKNEFYSDRAEIVSVISNIVSNGLKYFDPKKKEKQIEIDIRILKTKAIISIKDNGIGMSKNTLSKIFELSYQKNKAPDTGAGIGLHLVKTSLNHIKGKVQVKSELGIGSEFIISIPNLKSHAG